MKMIWNRIDRGNEPERKKIRRFLFFNTLCWTLIGLAAWGIVRLFAFNTAAGALSFAGYAGYFAGWFGGIVFLWRR